MELWLHLRRAADGQGAAARLERHQPAGARRRPLADDEVELEILHGGIENLFHVRTEAMNFIDKQHIVGLKIGHDGRDVARFL